MFMIYDLYRQGFVFAVLTKIPWIDLLDFVSMFFSSTVHITYFDYGS